MMLHPVAGFSGLFKAPETPWLGIIIGLVLLIRPARSSDDNPAWKVRGRSPKQPLWMLLQRLAGAALVVLSCSVILHS